MQAESIYMHWVYEVADGSRGQFMSESLEHADHAKEAARENRAIALLIAVIAFCALLATNSVP